MSTTLEQFQYGFDRDSRRTWQKRSLSDTQDQHYSYDSLSQVSAAARGSLNLNMTAIGGRPASAESWDYDPTGNWRGYHTAANGVSTLDQHRVHDRGNRLTQIEDNPHNMILDRVGRMRQMVPDAEGDWDGKLELTWDAWSRITSVMNNGTVVGDYAYDGQHRRTTRQVGSDTLHSYYNDEWRPVEERKDSETTASMSYLWGARHRDDLVRRDRATSGTSLNESRYVLMDYFNPAAITDESGTVKERYAFSAFGLRTILNPDYTLRGSSECAMEFDFQGQFLDAESGLLNYGYRYYSPQLGRWTCKDPIEQQGGINIYAYAGNNSVNLVDYLGLYDEPGPGDQFNPFGLRGDDTKDYRKYFETRFPNSIKGARSLLRQRIVDKLCAALKADNYTHLRNVEVDDVDINPDGKRFGDTPQGTYESKVKIGYFEVKAEPAHITWRSHCSYHYETIIYIEETTGANPPSERKSVEDLLWWTGMFASRKVRMAEWKISSYGACPDCCDDIFMRTLPPQL